MTRVSVLHEAEPATGPGIVPRKRRSASSPLAPDSWTHVIRPKSGLVPLDFAELWRFRELLVFLVWRTILIRYKQTVIGVAWAVIQPLVTIVVFTVIFGKVAKLPSEGAPYALMTMAAVLPWQFFANALAVGSNSVVSAGNMVRKVYFPRLFIPFGECMSGILDFGISLLLLFVLMIWFQVALSWRLALLPLFTIVALLAAVGPSLWLSSLNVKYRDVKYIVPFLLQVGLYVSPVGFKSSIVPEKWQFWYHLNPLVGVIDGFRWCILGPTFAFRWDGFLLSLCVVVATFVSGLYYFRGTERTFADVI